MYRKFLFIGPGYLLNEIKETLAGIVLEIETVNSYNDARRKIATENISLIIFDSDTLSSGRILIRKYLKFFSKVKTPYLVLSSDKSISAILEAKENKASDYILKPYNKREFIFKVLAILGKQRISCIGGGTGLFNLLLGLKSLPNVLLTSIVSTADDGGSSGRLSDTFGILPPGDIRRSLIALSEAPEIMIKMMQYRFSRGRSFGGHSFGNILLTVMNEITGSMSEGVSALGDILDIRGIVRPIADTESRLCALFENGVVIRGESNIDLCKGRTPDLRIKRCWHEPRPRCNLNAFSSIINSDFVIIGPGDLFTSVITDLIIKEIRQALTETKAKKIYICNLMTKPGETAGFDAVDHIREVVKYLKRDCLDYVIISDIAKLSRDALLRYSKKGQFPVGISDKAKLRNITKAKIVVADVAHETELIRHDSNKIRNEITKIIQGKE